MKPSRFTEEQIIGILQEQEMDAATAKRMKPTRQGTPGPASKGRMRGTDIRELASSLLCFRRM